MKKIIIILLLLLTNSLYSQNEEVKKVVLTFFEGFHTRDTTIMKSVCLEKMILQSISETTVGAQLKNETVHDFYRSIASIPTNLKFEEKIQAYNIQYVAPNVLANYLSLA